MCLRVICHYTFCHQKPYSWIVRPCRPKERGLCPAGRNTDVTAFYEVHDFCPECYMADDPRKAPTHDTPIKRFDNNYGFELMNFEGITEPEEMDAVLDRTRAFVTKNFEPDQWDNLYIFCPPDFERFNRDVFEHIHRLVFTHLLPYFWVTVRADRGHEMTRERRISILQLRQAALQDEAFNFLQTWFKTNKEEYRWKHAVGAKGPWLATVIDSPADDRCGICLSPLKDEITVVLDVCPHQFHEDCLIRAWNHDLCPACRKYARGPDIKVSVPASGPMPKWLYEIAPFQRPRNQQELRSQEPPTGDEINAMQRAFIEAEDRSSELFKEVLRGLRALIGRRALSSGAEAACENLLDDISADKWDQINDEIPKDNFTEENKKVPIREIYERYRRNQFNNRQHLGTLDLRHRMSMEYIDEYEDLPPDPSLPVNYRHHQHMEWTSARDLYRYQMQQQRFGKAIEGLYFYIIGIDKMSDLITAGEEEREVQEWLQDSEHAWRVSIFARDRAKEKWQFALYHTSLFRNQ